MRLNKTIIGLLSIGMITVLLCSIFKNEVNFSMINDQVNYFDDTYFAFYNGNEKLSTMPKKDNNDNLAFYRGLCDNGASIEWNEEEWAPLVKKLTKSKTKCTIYFKEKVSANILLEQKLKEEELSDDPQLMYDDTTDRNLRYIGSSPDNYLDIGDRDSNGNPILWRIIGLMNNITSLDNGEKQESLLKIIRADVIGKYTWDTSISSVNLGYGINEWSQADLMKLLNPEDVYTKDGEIGNSLYWNNESGKCYTEPNNGNIACDFTSSGISLKAKEKIAKVRWNTGTFADYNESEWTASATYKAERSNNNGQTLCKNNGGGGNCTDNVNRTTTWDGYIALMYPSDYGYAVGKSVRNTCLLKSMHDYGSDDCYLIDWLAPDEYYDYTITPIPRQNGSSARLCVANTGELTWTSNLSADRPVAYLKSNIKLIDATGTKEDPFIAS